MKKRKFPYVPDKDDPHYLDIKAREKLMEEKAKRLKRW